MVLLYVGIQLLKIEGRILMSLTLGRFDERWWVDELVGIAKFEILQ